MKNYLLTLTLLLPIISASGAEAGSVLKQVQVAGDNQINLLFDQAVSEDQVKLEYFRDIVQLTFKNVSVYPAKILTLSSKEMKKIFAYQYTPQTIRTRITVEGKAEDYKDRFVVDSKGKIFNVKLIPGSLPITVATKGNLTPAQNQDETPASQAAPQKADLSKARSKGEDELLKRIMEAENASGPKGKLTGGPNLQSPLTSLAWMALVIGMMGVLFYGIKRMRNRTVSGNSRFARGISKLISRKGAISSNESIEVIANHYLGPRKSIAVVKVMGAKLVVGVTEDSINLITRIDAKGSAVPVTSSDAQQNFEDALISLNEADEPSVAAAPQSSTRSNIRDSIRQRIGSMKAL